MRHATRAHRTRHAIALVAVVAFLVGGFSPSLAQAADSADLTEKITGESQLVIGLNVDQLRSSKHFKEALQWARNNAGEGDLLRVLEDGAGVDVSSDIGAIALGVPQSEGTNARERQEFSAVIDGDFDEAKLVEALRESDSEVETTEKGGEKVYRVDAVEFSLDDDGKLWAAAGPEAYVGHAWSAFTKGERSVDDNEVLSGLLSDVETSKTLWMVGDTSDMQQAQDGAPQPENIGLSLDLSEGLVLEMLANMSSSEDAQASVEQFEQLKKQHGANPAVSMLGAGPLVSNLTTRAEESKIRADTRMTSSEFDRMISSLKQMAASQSTGTQPMQPGTNGQPGQPQQAPAQPGTQQEAPGGDVDTESDDGNEESDDSKQKDGVEADFN